MATSKPRVTVTLDPEVYAVVRELSEINGNSMSRIIGDLVGAAQDTIRAVIDAGKRYESLEAGMKDQVKERFSRAEREITPAVDALAAELLALFDEDQDPRPVIRGSRPPHPPTHKGSGA